MEQIEALHQGRQEMEVRPIAQTGAIELRIKQMHHLCHIRGASGAL